MKCQHAERQMNREYKNGRHRIGHHQSEVSRRTVKMELRNSISGARKLLKMFGESKRCVKQFYIDLRDPVDMYASLWPLMLISFFSGISPFKCAGPPGNRHLETTFIGVANTVFHLVWYCTCYALRVINDKSLQAHLFNSKVSRFGEYIQIVTSFMALGFTLILCFLKRDKLRKLLHALTQIDRELIGLGANINYKTISQFVQVALLVQWLLKFAFLGATFFVMRKLENPPDFFEWAFFFLPFFILATLKLQFICLSQLIRNRLNYVNIVLNTLQLRERNRSSARGSLDGIDGSKGTRITCDVVKLTGGADSKRKNSDIIGALCRAHEEICDACDLAEQYFSHQMLTTVTIEFVVSLFNCYLMLDVAYNKSQVPGMDTTEFYAYFTFYTLISMGTVYGLLRSAETVTNQSEKCAINVHKLLNVLSPYDCESKDVLMRFSIQLLHRQIKFTACRLFPLDNTLIFTMVGAATCYLIILFQVGSSLNQ